MNFFKVIMALTLGLTVTSGVQAKPVSTTAEVEKSAKQRISAMKVFPSMEVNLWADELQTQNPAFFSFDSQGRMLVVEANRLNHGVSDIRAFPDITAQDIMIQSSEDRVKMINEHSKRFTTEFSPSWYTDTSDTVRLISDKNKDGRADHTSLFADGFNDMLDGLASGVIERDGKVYLTSIPHLWQLEDKDNDGVAEYRKSLQDGFGIRVSFSGHDMHGLIWGPDGKLYWSIGDRGYSFTTKEGKKIHGPNMGAIFRADPDGSNIEEFYTGLRNPQELAFDKYGNLFTADNDGDGGDLERFVHVIEGGDSGWHAGHQSLMSFSTRLTPRTSTYTSGGKPIVSWMTEDRWHPRNDKQPAFMLPTIGQINGGPSGLTYNPANSFGEKFKDNFFVAIYKGSPAISRISSISTKPHGASFLSENGPDIVSGLNVSDVDFGPDGRLYFNEFNYSGWKPAGEGAIYSVSPKTVNNAKEQKQFEKILTSDFTQYKPEYLATLLTSEHMTIRQRAQFELAKHGQVGLKTFMKIAFNQQADELSRLHSIWGLGQLIRSNLATTTITERLITLLNDKNAHVRTQAARVLGDIKAKTAAIALSNALNDSNPQVVMYAAIAIGRIGYSPAIAKIIALIAKNNNQDLWLRHAYVMSLYGQNKADWLTYKNDESTAVRLAVLLALRKLQAPELGQFLDDPEPALVKEAMLAINDLDIVPLREALAKQLDKFIDVDKSKLPTAEAERFVHHRLINANFNLGTQAAAQRILAYASNRDLHPRLAEEALAAIEAWHDLDPIDVTTGLPSTMNKERANLAKVVTKHLPYILANVKGQALAQAFRLADKYKYVVPTEALLTAVNEQGNKESLRLEALSGLVKRNVKGLDSLLLTLTKDKKQAVRQQALSQLVGVSPAKGLIAAKAFLAKKDYKSKQLAFKALMKIKDPSVINISETYLQRLIANQLQPELSIEVIALARVQESTTIKALLTSYDQKMASANTLTKFAGARVGGDVQQGKALFNAGGAAECMRCHIVNKRGGKVGPDLSSIGLHRDSHYLLRALVEPSADIAFGYGNVTLTLASDDVISGLYANEDDKNITVTLSDGKNKTYVKSELKKIDLAMSGMPPMGYLLKDHEIRDIIAYLSTLKRKKVVRKLPTSH